MTEQPDGYQPWSQYGIPQQVYFTHSPPGATQTWLCEGEWDAIMLGWAVRHSALRNDIQVCCFTYGAGNVPPDAEIARISTGVVVFYDLDEAGRKGEAKVAERLGDRAKVAKVPSPTDPKPGWDVSDALNFGFALEDFSKAAQQARSIQRQLDPPRPSE
ncbi:toprim domain-containing protein [bacterium]|nr:toprim domain-containing protein [bacterium]